MSVRPLINYAAVLLIFSIAGCGGDAPPKAEAIPETTHAGVEVLMQRMVEEEHFTGAVLVAGPDEVLHAKGYGRATPESANSVDTLFHVASLTKQFTAAAVLQLVEDGKVDLGLSINRYLPDEHFSPRWETVSVRHLLTHSSGIPDYAVERDYYDVVDGFCLGDTVDGMIREAMAKELEFPPGSQFSYANLGFTLLGEIIEEQTGQAYADYLEDNVLAPMGMTSSRVHVEGHVPFEREADGYRYDEEQQSFVPDDVVRLPVTAPDGGLVTSLADFRAFAGIYTGDAQDILSAASLAAMTSPQLPSDGKDGPMPSYGYGIAVGSRFLGHSGYIVGFRSQFLIDRRTGMLIAVFSNNTANSPQRVALALLDLLQAD